ncbi:unnamed protein product, partial [Rotaria magnacalcarata]
MNLTDPVRVCRDCFAALDDTNKPTTAESPTKSATPISIQNGCRQANGTQNGTFNAGGGGGQK